MAARRASKVDSNPTQIRLQKKTKISKFAILMISSHEIRAPVFRQIKLNSKITRLNSHFLIIEGTARPLGQKHRPRYGIEFSFPYATRSRARKGKGKPSVSAP